MFNLSDDAFTEKPKTNKREKRQMGLEEEICVQIVLEDFGLT